MATVNLHVRSNPYYSFNQPLDGYNYKFTVKWNLTTEKYYMAIKGLNNDVDIKGIALLPGKNLFDLGYVELGELWVIDNSNEDAPENPTYADMGERWTVEYTTVS